MNKLYVLTLAFVFSLSISAYAEEPQSLNELQKIAATLEQRKADLDRREADISAREKLLSIKEEELLKKENQITQMKEEVSKYLAGIKESEDKNMDMLAKFYATTKPKSAAAIISKMELDKAVKLFQKIDPRAAGKILSAMGKSDPEFASKVTEQLTPEALNSVKPK